MHDDIGNRSICLTPMQRKLLHLYSLTNTLAWEFGDAVELNKSLKKTLQWLLFKSPFENEVLGSERLKL